MSKLFSLTLESGEHKGQKLIGITEDSQSTVKHAKMSYPEMTYIELGKLSEITEDQAKHLGFGPDEDSVTKFSAKEALTYFIECVMKANGNDAEYLDNVLLILINKK